MAITSLEQVTEFPLCWPPDKSRAARREKDPWKARLADAQKKIEDEMRRAGARGYVVSMAPVYRQGPVDPGVAVWFNAKPRADGAPGELRVLACDKFVSSAGNLHAIGLTVDRLRAIERYGAYELEQALEGAKLALPPPGEVALREWWKVLECEQAWPLPAIEGMYRGLAKQHASDPGRMRDLNIAIEAARKAKA